MQQAHVNQLIDSMKDSGVGFEEGLSDQEISAVQIRYGFRFPPDLRQFIQTGLPVSDERFPNWRSSDVNHLRNHVSAPIEGLIFDVEHNNMWMPEWGERPTSMTDAIASARIQLKEVPKMIPIFGNRFIPDEPNEAGNPVFSMHQADIIYGGYDLADYLSKEFDIPNPTEPPSEPRQIRFWSQFI